MTSSLTASEQDGRPGKGYSVPQRTTHWAVLVFCLKQVPTSWAIRRTHLAQPVIEPDPFDLFLHEIHAWSGWLILLLALGQLGLRLVLSRTAHPKNGSWLELQASTQAHWALYGLLIALPITGTIAMYVTFSIVPVHSQLSRMLLFVVVIHVAAALWHHFYRRDDVLRRMIGHIRRSGTGQMQ